MKRNTRLSAATAATLLLAGCANTTFHIPFMDDAKSTQPDYSKSRAAIQNRPLEVPPDLSAPDTSANFTIPGLDDKLSTEGKKALATGAVLPKFEKVRIEGNSDVRWLVVSSAPETVWPIARQFWIDQGFKLTQDDPLAGLIETSWEEERPDLPVGGIRAVLERGLHSLYSTGSVDQYRMRLERGTEPNTTEIYISHRGMDEIYVTDKATGDTHDTKWVERKPDPEREATELKQLLVRLGLSADVAGQMVAAAPAPVTDAKATDAQKKAEAFNQDRATLITQADGKRLIQLNESFDRAWRRVGQALERAGYSIGDRDRSLGIYYVHPGNYTQTKNEPSVWSKLEFWKSEDKSIDKDLESKGPEYLVVVAGKDGQATVRAGTRDGSPLPEATSSTLLKSLVTELR